MVSLYHAMVAPWDIMRENLYMEDRRIFLIDKPAGITSFDVIRVLRKKLGIKKMGHAGTLDPLATGLLIVGVGDGTKDLTKYIKLPKTYEADILFGTKTDTGDTDGKVIEERSAAHLSKEDVVEALQKIIGTHLFPVPFYSAIKISGVRLYAHARKGDVIELPKKEMTVSTASLISFRILGEKAVASVSLDVSSGTYIRTLAEEIGNILSLPATIQRLRRIRVGDFSINNAVPLSEIPDA